MAAGMGAGIAAIFRAPLAGALFAAEVLYRSPEFEPEVIMPAAIASVVSYCTFGPVAGWKPLFHDARPGLSTNPWQLGPYLLAGAVHGRAGHALYAHVLRHDAPVPPAAVAAAFPAGDRRLPDGPGRPRCSTTLSAGNRSVLAVLAFGYGSLQQAMTDGRGHQPSGVLLAIALGKILTTSLTIGSGGSGGVFGPSMVIGGCGGGALGHAAASTAGRAWCRIRPAS